MHSFSSTVGVLPGSYHWNAFIHLAESRIHGQIDKNSLKFIGN